MFSKEHIISEIRRTSINGKALGKIRFQTVTGIKESDWAGKYWVNWNDAVREAGITPNKMQTAYSTDYLVGLLVNVIKELNRFPTFNDLRIQAKIKDNFPSHNTFQRLGSKSEIAQLVIDYCSNKHDYKDIITIAQPVSIRKKPVSFRNRDLNHIEFSFVYLMKYDKYYKIGRSKVVEKREYEIGLKLPEKPKTIHKIKTDDPVGIEEYWHKRFADKRVRGEWFSLTAQDIQIFKHRTFM